MEDQNRARQQMLEQGNLYYIPPVKPVKDPTRNLIQSKFGDIFVTLKPENMTWTDYYIFLFNYYNAGLKGIKHYWDTDIQSKPIIKLLFETKIPITWLEKYNKGINTEGADFAAAMGNFEVLKWLADQNIFPSIQGIIQSAKNGYDILKFTIDHKIYDAIDNYEDIIHIIVASAESGNINFIKYIEPNYIIDALYVAVIKGNFEAIKMLLSYPALHFIGIPGNDDTDIIRNFFNAPEEDLDWMIIIDNIIYKLSMNCRLDILKWLVSRDIKLDSTAANGAATGGCINILKWLYENYGIVPDDIDDVIDNQDIDVLELLKQYNVFLNNDEINRAIKNNKLKVVNWLVENGFIN